MRNLVFAVTLATVSALCLAPVAGTAAADPSISVAASNWKFTPGTITVHVNQTTTLHFTSKEGVHAVGAPELGISNTTLMPGKTVAVTFTPKKLGTFDLHCMIPCGPGHSDMKLIVKVVQ